MKITIERIKGIELEDHKLYLEKWHINNFVRYCILQIDYLSLPDSHDSLLRNTKHLFSKTRGPFYDSKEQILESWEKAIEYVKSHCLMYAIYDTSNIMTFTADDSHQKISDENYSIVSKLREFIYLYRKENNNG